MLASKKLTIIHYATALKCFKKENVTNYRFETFYACAVIVTSQSTSAVGDREFVGHQLR